jgi:hypothetical protein
VIFRRIKAHVVSENWFAVFIDFIIVVFGVFMGFQVQAWNEARSDDARTRAYLERIHADVGTDIESYALRLQFWKQVSDYGMLALDYVNSKDSDKSADWKILLAFFQSSQTGEFITTQATFDELRNAGELRLIGNVQLRTLISGYYTGAGNAVLTERPAYRENVRGRIPMKVQYYIWQHCYSLDPYLGQTLLDCSAPEDLLNAGEIADKIAANSALMFELRYWISTVHVASLISESRAKAATILQKAIKAELGEQKPKTIL